MTAVDDRPQPPPAAPPDELLEELENVGFVRRILRARRWYGADWWFVAISSVLVFLFALVALFPGAFAPHDPRAEVGPRNLAPGESTESNVLLSRTDDDIASLGDLAGSDRVPFGVVVGSPASNAARDQAQVLTDELSDQGSDDRVRLRITRFDTPEEMLAALSGGEVVAGSATTTEIGDLLDDHPDVEVNGTIEGEATSSESFLLGTNQLGQDVFSRIIWGTRISFQVGLGAALFALVIGAPLGLLAGYVGRWPDRVLSLVMDSLYAFPGLILAIAIAAVLGPSILNVIVAIAVLYVPTYFRIVRGQTLAAKEDLYVEAARSIGATTPSIIGRYISPNIVPSVAIIFSVNVADGILTGAGLSFLGLGLPPDIPDWGIDLARGQESIQSAWWLITFPGLAVMLVVLSFTMMGEGLVEIFNPKLRER
jgi:peptide/nickel transport system permease protein